MSSDVPDVSVGLAPRNGEVIVRVRDGLRQGRRLCGVLSEYVRLEGSTEETAEDTMAEIVQEYRDELWDDWEYDTDIWGRSIQFPREYAIFAALKDRLARFEMVMDNSRGQSPDGMRDAWGRAFLVSVKALRASIEGPTLQLANTGDWEEETNIDEFWESVDDMQLQLVALLRYVYDWKTAIAVSANKKLIQESMEWRELSECCVWILQQGDLFLRLLSIINV